MAEQKSRRVVVVGFNNQIGGTRTAFQEFTKHLIRAGHRVGIVAISDSINSVPSGTSFVRTIPFSRKLAGLNKIPAMLQAAVTCRKFLPDMLVSIGVTTVGSFLSRAVGDNCYRVCQDVIFGRNPAEPRFRDACKAFDAIAPQSPSMESALRHSGMRGRMRWLPCFGEQSAGSQLASPRCQPPFSVAYFGRVVEHKGLDLLIKAMAGDLPPLNGQIDVWGTGDTEKYSGLATQFGVQDRIRFLGPYPDDQMRRLLMTSYDAVILPTKGNEGLPLILVEAMSYGLPLLTTAVAAIPDCCNKNPDAIMVSPTVEGIHNGLRELSGKLTERKFIPARQAHFYNKNFSHQAMGIRWAKCIENPDVFFSSND